MSNLIDYLKTLDCFGIQHKNGVLLYKGWIRTTLHTWFCSSIIWVSSIELCFLFISHLATSNFSALWDFGGKEDDWKNMGGRPETGFKPRSLSAEVDLLKTLEEWVNLGLYRPEFTLLCFRLVLGQNKSDLPTKISSTRLSTLKKIFCLMTRNKKRTFPKLC